MKHRICLLIILFLTNFPVWAQSAPAVTGDVLLLNSGQLKYKPTRYISFLEDKGSQLTIDKVADPSYASQFQPLEKDNINFGLSASSFWLRLHIKNTTPRVNDWLLEVGYPLLDYVDIYAPDTTGNWQHKKLGDMYPYHTRDILHRNFLCALDQPDTLTRTYYLRIHTSGIVIAPLEILRNKELPQETSRNEIVYGVFYGIVLVMLFYNLMIFMFFGDKSYLYYVLALLGTFGYLFTINGHGFQYIWTDTWWNSKMATVMVGVWLIGSSLFTQSFLNTQKYAPALSKAFTVVLLLGVAMIVGTFTLPYNSILKMAVVMVLLNSCLMLLTGIICGRRGSPAANYFIIAWLLYIIASITTSLRNSGVVGNNALVSHSADFGLVAQVVLLSLALSDKYRLIDRERKRVQAEALKMQLEANEQLEKKVIERTAEINQQKEEIEAQRDNLELINGELAMKHAEINQQKEEIEAQRDNLELINGELAMKHAEINQQKEEIEAQRDNLELINGELEERKAEIENAYRIIEESNRQTTDSIRYAQTIQQAILPDKRELTEALGEHFVLYRPKDIVSGDFYWCSRSNGYTFIAVVDCTGHGVPGAFMSMIGNTLLNEIINQKRTHNPDEVLEALNQEIQLALRQKEQTNDDGMDICLCRLERLPDGHTRVVFCGAKRPLYYIPADNPTLHHLKGNRKSIGGRQRKDLPFISQELVLDPGAMIYLFSDGIGDQNDVNNKRFGDALAEVIVAHASACVEDQKLIIEQALNAHQGSMKQRDDITAIGIRIQ